MPSNEHKAWLALWDTNAPAKAKIHTWRLLKNGLAVGTELHRRRIKPGVFCCACGREETIHHRFWACPHSMLFWKHLCERMAEPVVMPPVMDGSLAVLVAWFKEWLAEAGGAERETMIQALYGLWCARNDTRDGRRIQDARELAEKVHTHIHEWRQVNSKEATVKEQRRSERWSPPDPGWIKANADGATSRTDDKGGGGVVLRDHHGAFRGGAAICFPGAGTPQLSEILAAKSAVQMAISMDVQRLHVELDSQEVVAMLRGDGRNLSTFGPVVEEIRRC